MAVKPAAKTSSGAKPSTAVARRNDPVWPVTSAEIAHAQGAPVIPAKLTDEDLLRDARAGLENITVGDMAIPRLGILQALSPQMNPRDAAFIDGAQIGEIYENINQQTFDGETGVLLVLVHFNHADIEWRPERKGFVKSHPPAANILSQTTRNEKTGDNVLPSGNLIVPTHEYYSFLINEDEGTYSQCLISLAKTDMKEARRLASVASNFQHQLGSGKWITPALFFRSYRFTTVPKKNEKGNWFGWKFEPAANTVDLFPETGLGAVIYKSATAYREAVNAGKVKVADPQAGHEGAAPPDDKAPI